MWNDDDIIIDHVAERAVTALNFVRLGFAVALTPRIAKKAQLGQDYQFKSPRVLEGFWGSISTFIENHDNNSTTHLVATLFGQSAVDKFRTKAEFSSWID